MDPNLFLARLPRLGMIAIGNESFFAAQNKVVACEACDQSAFRTFSTVLDEVTNRSDCLSEYILSEPAKCSRCGSEIFEMTLVVVRPELNRAFSLAHDPASTSDY